MATLTAKLTLTSSNATSDSLNLTASKTLTTTEPSINIARAAILHTAPTELLSAAAHTAAADEVYFYVKNTDSTNFVAIKTAGAVDFARLRAGEFMFLPLREAIGLEGQAHTATCVVEYGYWKRA
tara:strand:+ start:77 stop:451 length:375 start_codon:yes stop_codon:yes gene_type:complete